MSPDDQQVVELLAQEIVQAPIDDLTPHPDNPNEGDVGAIDESVSALGNVFYQVIFVQRSTGRIVAGEHRWRTLKARGSQVAPVVYLDIDDEQAMRILVGDNEIARERSRPKYDVLAQVLLDLAQQSSAGIKGTGYDDEMLNDLLALQTGPPALADVLQQHGNPQDGDFWPTIRLVVPQEMKKRYLARVGHLADDQDRLRLLLDAADKADRP